MADLTLGPTFPAEGTLSLTTDWKEIEVSGDAGFVLATPPIAANMVYGHTPGGGAIEHEVPTSSGAVSIWSRPVAFADSRKKVYVKLTTGGPTSQNFEAR